MNIGTRIKELRKSMQLTQQELADRLGIDRSTIAKYETNSRIPEAKTIVQLAKFFDCTTDFLLGISDY